MHEETIAPESASINPINGMNYWLIVFILLTIARLIITMVIVVKYYTKRGLTIPCFHQICIEMSIVRKIDIKNTTYYF